MTELKPCPFCGNHGAHEKNCYINLFFESEVLDADIPWEVMANAWNTRYERTCHDIAKNNEAFRCSECGCRITGGYVDNAYIVSGDWNFCPNCEAKIVDEVTP